MIIKIVISLAVKQLRVIRNAMRDWESKTCVNFQQINDGNYSRPYVRILNGQGCYSHVGMTGKHGQLLSIGDTCYQVLTKSMELSIAKFN